MNTECIGGVGNNMAKSKWCGMSGELYAQLTEHAQ
jgi:hypothetical protein